MIHPFGGPVHLIAEGAENAPSAASAHDDIELVRRTLAGLNDAGTGFLRIYRPRPTAAFSPRDAISRSFNAAAEAVRGHGFEPVERLAGGQLAVYDSNALVIDLVAAHAEPRAQVLKRFELFSKVIISALATLSIDARLGALAGEYCPGEYSVNGAGRIKLAGLAQRIGRRGYHLGAMISVMPSHKAEAAIATAYRILGITFNPATFGAVADLTPNLSFKTVRDAIMNAIAAQLDGWPSTAGAREERPSAELV